MVYSKFYGISGFLKEKVQNQKMYKAKLIVQSMLIGTWRLI